MAPTPRTAAPRPGSFGVACIGRFKKHAGRPESDQHGTGTGDVVIASDYLPWIARSTILLSSRIHNTELATSAQRSQSRELKAMVENACCRKGV
jgi:hypothetical protein